MVIYCGDGDDLTAVHLLDKTGVLIQQRDAKGTSSFRVLTPERTVAVERNTQNNGNKPAVGRQTGGGVSD